MTEVFESPVFDPLVHLAYEEPAQRITMAELGLEDVGAPSDVGVTSPFQLCSLEGVKAMRKDILQPKVLENHMVYSEMTGPHCQLRGMASTYSSFVKEFWRSETVLDAVSNAAGCQLVPVFDYELGHVNIQIPKNRGRMEYTSALNEDPFLAREDELPLTPPPESSDEAELVNERGEETKKVADASDNSETPLVVGWHRDAYPWVCVLMLSEVSRMKGGETAILRSDGSILKAIGPQIGSAVVMQGGYIQHCALPCSNGTGVVGELERITMVTSFRPKYPMFRDVSNLDNIRSCSSWYELYDQWVQSRLQLAQERIYEYSQVLSQRRSQIESAQSAMPGSVTTRTFLDQPTVDLDEFDRFQQELNDLFMRAKNAMRPYDDPANVFTQPSPTHQALNWKL